MREIKEADWKIFRRLQKIALDRYCQQILGDVSHTINDNDKDSHQKYLEISQFLYQKNREMAKAFDNPRRSDAYRQLALLKMLGLLTEPEWEQFSLEALDVVETRVANAF